MPTPIPPKRMTKRRMAGALRNCSPEPYLYYQQACANRASYLCVVWEDFKKSAHYLPWLQRNAQSLSRIASHMRLTPQFKDLSSTARARFDAQALVYAYHSINTP